MAIIVNGDGILTGVSSLATALTDLTSGRGTVTGVATVGTLQLGAGVSMSSPRTQNAAIFTNNTEFLTVDDAGRIGIGTISPNTDAHPQNVGKINVGFITARSVAGDIDGNTLVVAGIATFTNASTFKNNVTVTSGNLTMSGAGNIVLGDSSSGTDDRITFGASTDMEIFHNGTNNHIDCHTAGQELYIRPTKDVYFQDYVTDDVLLKMVKDGAVELYHNNSKKIETSSSGITISGDNSTGSYIKGVARFTPNDSTTVKVIWDEGGFSGAGSFQVKDGVAFTAGNSSDLKLYHDGSHSNIINTTGVLKVRGAAGQSITFRNGDDSANVAVFNVDDATHLYHDSAHKFSTTSGGVKTVGQAEIDGNCFPYSDNNSDLGLSANRWQDLYLSGNIYLGGTGSANALDDYEEGTFTPVLDNSLSSVSYNAQVGHYTKIGNQVFGYVYLLATAGSSTAGSLRVSGLPFTSNSVQYHEGGGYTTYLNGTFGTSGVEMQAKPWVPQNQTYVLFHTPEDGNNLLGNETNFANKYLIFHIRYKAA